MSKKINRREEEDACMQDLLQEILSQFRPAEPVDAPEGITYLSTQELLEMMEGIVPDVPLARISSELYARGCRLQLVGEAFRWALVSTN